MKTMVVVAVLCTMVVATGCSVKNTGQISYEDTGFNISFQYPDTMRLEKNTNTISLRDNETDEWLYVVDQSDDLCNAALQMGMETVNIQGNVFIKFAKTFKSTYGYAIVHPKTKTCLEFAQVGSAPQKELTQEQIATLEKIIHSATFK